MLKKHATNVFIIESLESVTWKLQLKPLYLESGGCHGIAVRAIRVQTNTLKVSLIHPFTLSYRWQQAPMQGRSLYGI